MHKMQTGNRKCLFAILLNDRSHSTNGFHFHCNKQIYHQSQNFQLPNSMPLITLCSVLNNKKQKGKKIRKKLNFVTERSGFLGFWTSGEKRTETRRWHALMLKRRGGPGGVAYSLIAQRTCFSLAKLQLWCALFVNGHYFVCKRRLLCCHFQS